MEHAFSRCKIHPLFAPVEVFRGAYEQTASVHHDLFCALAKLHELLRDQVVNVVMPSIIGLPAEDLKHVLYDGFAWNPKPTFIEVELNQPGIWPKDLPPVPMLRFQKMKHYKTKSTGDDAGSFAYQEIVNWVRLPDFSWVEGLPRDKREVESTIQLAKSEAQVIYKKYHEYYSKMLEWLEPANACLAQNRARVTGESTCLIPDKLRQQGQLTVVPFIHREAGWDLPAMALCFMEGGKVSERYVGCAVGLRGLKELKPLES